VNRRKFCAASSALRAYLGAWKMLMHGNLSVATISDENSEFISEDTNNTHKIVFFVRKNA